jgi:hypothetical protein
VLSAAVAAHPPTQVATPAALEFLREAGRQTGLLRSLLGAAAAPRPSVGSVEDGAEQNNPGGEEDQ